MERKRISVLLKSRLISYGKVLALFVALTSFTGCAQKALTQNMTVPTGSQQYASQYQASVSVDKVVTKSGFQAIAIDKQGFQEAVVASLINAGLYTENGKYKLNVELVKIEQPLMGLDMTVTMTVEYTLKDSENNNVVFQKSITEPYTATFSDAAIGVTRFRMATEGSVKANIASLLKEFQSAPEIAVEGENYY